MTKTKTDLQERIESGNPILIAELSPPVGSDPEPMREAARRFAGKVHAVGISDNRRRVCMSALAAASLTVAEGVEPILHVVTRDRNRIALVSDCLGADALGIRNLLCTTGTHQTLGRFREAKNVFDIDSVQLLRTCGSLASNGELVGEDGFEGAGPFCLGATANAYADPFELQLVRVAKKVSAGARFLITAPVFDVERFEGWLAEVVKRGMHEQVAMVAGIQPLCDAESARAFAESRPLPMVPEKVLERLASGGDTAAQHAAGIEIAVETIQRLSAAKGLRGFQVRADTVGGEDDVDVALEVIEKSGLRTD